MRGCVFVVFTVIFFFLTGCSDDEGSLPPLPPEPAPPASGSISGTAADALITNGTLKIYAFNSDGTVGDLLAETTTDGSGFYDLTPSMTSQPIILEITDGSYIEEASGRNVSMEPGQFLRAVTYYEEGGSIEVMVTPFTNLAAALALYEVQHDLANVNNAITEANTALSTMAGLNIITTTPKDVTDEFYFGSLIDDGLKYGFLTAAISLWTEEASTLNGFEVHTQYTSIALAQLMYRDILADGLLDGVGFTDSFETALKPLSFGTVPLDANVYRYQFAQKLLEFASHENNATNLGIGDLLNPAKSLAVVGDSIFGGVTPVPLDEEAPLITPVDPPGNFYSGTIEYKFTVTDLVGTQSITVSMDGTTLHSFANLESEETLSLPINTANFSDGNYNLVFEVRDNVENTGVQEFAFNVLNTGPVINFNDPLREGCDCILTNDSSFELTGTFSENSVALASVTADGVEADIDQETSTWSINVPLDVGVQVATVVATDTLGNETQQTVRLGLDLSPPVFKFGMPNGSYQVDFVSGNTVYQSPWDFDTSSLVHYRTYDNLGLGGAEFTTTNLELLKIPYLDWSMEDATSDLAYSEDRNVRMTYTYEVGNTVIVSNQEIVAEPSLYNNTWLFAISNESLPEEWASFSEDLLHEITITATDEAGNTRNQEIRFYVRVSVPEIALTSRSTGSGRSGNTSFANKTSISSENYEVERFTFSNPLQFTGTWFKLEDSGNNSVRADWASKLYKNRYRLETKRWYGKCPNDQCPEASSTKDKAFKSEFDDYANGGPVYQWQNGTATKLDDNGLTVDGWVLGNEDTPGTRTFQAATLGFPGKQSSLHDLNYYIDSWWNFTPTNDPNTQAVDSGFYQFGSFTISQAWLITETYYKTYNGYPKLVDYRTGTGSGSSAGSTRWEVSINGVPTEPNGNGWYLVPGGGNVVVNRYVDLLAPALYFSDGEGTEYSTEYRNDTNWDYSLSRNLRIMAVRDIGPGSTSQTPDTFDFDLSKREFVFN